MHLQFPPSKRLRLLERKEGMNNDAAAGDGEISVKMVSLDRPQCTVRGRLSEPVRAFAERAAQIRAATATSSLGSAPSKKPRREGPLRLIFQGRLLDTNTTAAAAGLRDGCTVHCVATAAAAAAETEEDEDVRIDVEASESGDESDDERIAVAPRRRGLERLADFGFSAAEIAQFRSLFRAEAAASGLHVASGAAEQRPEEIAAEEEWLSHAATALAQDDARLQNAAFAAGGDVGDVGGRAEIIFGFVLGSLIGPLMLIWIFLGGGLSTRAKAGIVLGVSVNLLLSTASRMW